MFKYFFRSILVLCCLLRLFPSLPFRTIAQAGYAVGSTISFAHNPKIQPDPHAFDNVLKVRPQGEEKIDSNILSLAKPLQLNLPKTITISKNSLFFKESIDYVLTQFVGRGADGVVYEGYEAKKPKDLLIFKCYVGGFYWWLGYDAAKSIFDTEVWVLQRLSRLVNVDRKNLVSVQPKIEGISLEDYLKNTSKYKESDDIMGKSYDEVIHEYLNLPSEFRKKWNLIHGDVRPSNVIIDRLGKMQLIDFGRSRRISTDKRKRLFEEMVDDDLARKALGMSYDWSSFGSYQDWLEMIN